MPDGRWAPGHGGTLARWRRRLLAGGSLLVAAAAAGCTTLDNALARFSWFTTMSDQVSVKPFELPRTPPPGSVPITGQEDSLDLLTGVTSLPNPVPRSEASLQRGQLLYDTYCIVCHGPAGHADGTVVPKFVPPPDLTLDASRQRTDGYIYAMIKQGRGIMPKYGDKIRGTDRWNVVNYVRKLQGVP